MRPNLAVWGLSRSSFDRRVMAVAVSVLMAVGGFVGFSALHGSVPPAGTGVPPLSPGGAAGITNFNVPATGSNGHFPSAGNDTFEVSAVVGLEFPGGPAMPPVVLTGAMTVQRGQPEVGPSGLMEISTQIVQMRLVAFLGGNPDRPLILTGLPTSMGEIVQETPASDFPATSFFDVFFDVSLGNEVLHNIQAFDVFTDIAAIPPTPGTTFQSNSTAPLTLYNATGAPVANLTTGSLTVGLVPCFFYTANGQPDSQPFCNPKANDVRIDFNQTAAGPCLLQYTLNAGNVSGPVQCPSGANDVEIFWGNPPLAPVITKCVWTANGKPLPGAICQVPALAPANDFVFTAGGILNVYWTVNGRLLKPVIPAPAGTNDVEFYRYSSGYPANENVTFPATGIVQLATLSGAPLPAVVVSGPTTVGLGTPVLLPNGTTEVPTQLLSMDLTGTSPIPGVGPVAVGLNPQMVSTGIVIQGSHGMDFPAHSFFDVFTEITVGGQNLTNTVADNMTSTLTAIPLPNGTTYQGPAGGPVTLYEPNGTPAYTLTSSTFIAGTPPCLYFTKDGLPAGAPVCSPRANDLTIDFKQTAGANCSVQFTLFGNDLGAPAVCPQGANDLEVGWENTASGALIDSCSWTRGGKPLPGAVCSVPPPAAPANDLTFSGNLTRVFWTLDGKPLKPVIRAPAGANDLEFFSYYDPGLPAAGTDHLNGSAFLVLQEPNGTVLPAVTLTGDTIVQRSAPQIAPATGLATASAALTGLQLTGNSSQGAVELGLNPQDTSVGGFNQLYVGGAFSVRSFFDVFTEISIGGQTYQNLLPVDLTATLSSIPATPGTMYNITGPVTYYAPSGAPAFNLTTGSLIVGSVGCAFFTSNGLPVSGPVCNPNANDIEVNFTQLPGAVCSAQFTLGGAAFGAASMCPTTPSANQLEVNWTGSAAGPVITSCDWAVSGVPVGKCVVPSPPQPDGFELNLAQIQSFSWTVNGQVVGKPIPAPATANDVEFFSYYNSGYPASGTDQFNASAMIDLQEPNGTLLPAVTLTGQVVVQRGVPVASPDTGLVTIPTMLESLSLSGNTSEGPVQITLNPQMPSVGRIAQLSPGVAFPATSFFDVFTDISLGGATYSDQQATTLSANISGIPPPAGTIYRSAPGATTAYTSASGEPAFNLILANLVVGPVGCAYFTVNDSPATPAFCDPEANDISVAFNEAPSAPCGVQFLNGGTVDGPLETCPTDANGIEVGWTASSSGPVIDSCLWESFNEPTGTCPFPSSPPSNGFQFTAAEVDGFQWTLNGQFVGQPVPAEEKAINDLELFL